MERLFATYAARRASSILGRVARVRVSNRVLKPIIDLYSIGVGVSMDEVDEPQGGFRSFSDFFGRRLRPGTRPICEDEQAAISPCDGEIVDFGNMNSSDNPTFVVKGSLYDLDGLLGAPGAGAPFQNGGYTIIHLHPRDYHRVHAPLSGDLYRIRHIPGKRYPVNGWLKNRVEGIYSKNERVVFHFNCADGELAVVMVAAFGVGNIQTGFNPGWSLGPDVRRERDFVPPVAVERSSELGVFLLGSTVVMIWSEGMLEWGLSFFSDLVINEGKMLIKLFRKGRMNG